MDAFWSQELAREAVQKMEAADLARGADEVEARKLSAQAEAAEARAAEAKNHVRWAPS